jgi:hypothetical protein
MHPPQPLLKSGGLALHCVFAASPVPMQTYVPIPAHVFIPTEQYVPGDCDDGMSAHPPHVLRVTAPSFLHTVASGSVSWHL